MSEKTALNDSDIAAAFRRVGLVSGDSLIVHSSFRSLKPVDGGPETVIRALLDVIGPAGNLMLPTFNYDIPSSDSYFDPEKTPTRTGIIPETGRNWPGAVRSLHPTHSVAVIGPDAEALTRGHLDCRTVGAGSPLDRLAQMGGKILLIGVGNLTNTTIHVGEEHAGAAKGPWWDEIPFLKVRLPDGSMVSHQLDTSTSCSAGFGAVDYPLMRKGKIQETQLAGARLMLMRGADVIETVCEMIAGQPDVLLCTRPGCRPCSGARAALRSATGGKHPQPLPVNRPA